MKNFLLFAWCAAFVVALPQAPKDTASNPSATIPKASTPKGVTPMPGGLPDFPFPDLSKLAHEFGFDPAKATPDPMGYQHHAFHVLCNTD